MLHFIPWSWFLTAMLLSTGIYYFTIVLFFYEKTVFGWLRKRLGLTALCACSIGLANAQDGNHGINQANTMIRGYFDTGTTLLLAIGGVLGLIGAVKVFKEWNSGHQQEAYRAAGNWFGSCLFLVLVASVLRSFFGL